MNETVTYTVPGMSCGHCKSAVEGAVGAVPGVEAVAVDLDTKVVEIRGASLDEAALRGAIEDAGYDVAA